jgi:hypothetical protein
VSAGPSNVPEGGVRSGNVHGVPVPSEVPLEGTSESLPSIALEGLADGENDVTVPPTTTF